MPVLTRNFAEKQRSAEESVPGAGTLIRAKAPLRISFAGGGTDIPVYYERSRGAVLSSTITRYAHVTLCQRDDLQIEIRSLDLGYSVNYTLEDGPVYDGMLDLAKAAIARVGIQRGVDIDVRMEAPPGSGLGGSSALTAAVLGAVTCLNGHRFSPSELAELNYIIERKDLKILGGRQDQYATTFGGFNLMEFAPDRVTVTPMRIEQAVLNDLEAHLLLCYTGKVRPNLGLVEQQIQDYRKGRPETLRALARLYALVYEMQAALLTGALDRFGEMIHESYLTKKLMNPRVTDGTQADQLYDTARKNGVIGGKLLGAGGGGYLLLFCDTGKQHKVRQSLEAMGGQFVDFSFEALGLQVWRSNSR